MDNNVRLYPYFYAACSFLAWLPIFFLYFSDILTLREVLLLESVYYISVVVLEVPTGYFSDAFGRRRTLILGAFFLLVACVAYIIGHSFWVLAIGQIFFALHMSFLSGTNTVFHYESLEAIGRSGEYGDREAMVNKYGMLAGGTAALIGGALGHFDLRLAYVATLMAAIISLLLALRFKEPVHTRAESGAIKNMIAQLSSTVGYLRNKPLAWIAAYYITIYMVTHIPYEFYQPYVGLLDDQDNLFGTSAPIMAGLLYAFARYFGAFGAAYSMVWKRRLGLKVHLFLQLFIINVIVLVMGLYLHPAIIMVVLLRSLPWAAIKAPINEVITPFIESGQRATFHSMLSLGCRLFFFVTLLGLSVVVPGGEMTSWANLSEIIRICFAVGLGLTLIIVMLSAFLRPTDTE